MSVTRVMNQNQKDRAGWYDQKANQPENQETKISASSKAKGELADGFRKVKTPEDKTGKPQTLKSTRDSVGAKWPGPGKMLHGKASPSSKESFIRVAKNKEFQAK